ncbi:MAG: ATP-binding protein [Clostridiales bacterium]|nr:ATP-binding protein [Clostridiales bacterium]
MKRSIFLRVFGSYVLLLFLLAALFLLFSFRTIKSHYLNILARDLQNLSRGLDISILSLVEENRLDELDAFLKNLGKRINTRLTVVDAGGVVLADSDEEPGKMENHRFRPEVYDALQGKIGRSLRYSSTVKEEMLYVALPLEKGEKIIGVVRASLFIKDIDVPMSVLRTDIGRAVMMIMAFSLVVAFFFSRNLTRPIRDLAMAFRRVAGGDFSAKMSLRYRDEWRDVAASFNAMTEEIKTLFANLRKRKEELDNILASMREGLLVLDKNGKIISSNQSAKKIIGQEPLEGKFYWEVLRATSFAELLDKVRKEKKECVGEVTLGEKYFLSSASFLPSEEQVILTLSGMTEMQNLARMKKDLVLSVSHELRTPLTAIKGFAETLAGELEEKNRRHVLPILRNADRLIRIVENLLVLSELEEKGIHAEREDVDLRMLVENVLKIFEPRAREKNLGLRFEAEGDLPPTQGDSFRMEQMIINLVDNAIKYTDKGDVRVSLKKRQNSLVLEVRDTGIGIPEESQARIFERFYVVDRSRSRKLGGAGLGLSIVKHIVELHGGTIHVESKAGQGSTFTVTLPLIASFR